MGATTSCVPCATPAQSDIYLTENLQRALHQSGNRVSRKGVEFTLRTGSKTVFPTKGHEESLGGYEASSSDEDEEMENGDGQEGQQSGQGQLQYQDQMLSTKLNLRRPSQRVQIVLTQSQQPAQAKQQLQRQQVQVGDSGDEDRPSVSRTPSYGAVETTTLTPTINILESTTVGRSPPAPLPKRYKPTVMPKSLLPPNRGFWPRQVHPTKKPDLVETVNPSLESMWTIQFDTPDAESEEEIPMTESDAEIPSAMAMHRPVSRVAESSEEDEVDSQSDQSVAVGRASCSSMESFEPRECHRLTESETEELDVEKPLNYPAGLLDRFEGCSTVTYSECAALSESSLYEAFEDTILTDYKCYTILQLDTEGRERRVDVKILKDLSQSLLSKHGISPSDQPVLFGLDPSLKLQRVYDHVEDLWVVSEHIPTTLKDVLSDNQFPSLPLIAKVYITSELIKKLAMLHERGVYMKNLGSASILLSTDGRVCPTNFLESALQKLKHQLVTSPEYLDTQEWNPLASDRQRQKDVFRLGQLIARLFVGNQIQHWIRNNDDIERMLMLERVPSPILQIVCRCLRSKQELVFMEEIQSYASFFLRDRKDFDLTAGRTACQLRVSELLASS